MSINVIAHNLPAMNAERTLGINTGNKNRAMEKLASGYKINRSADDAAGLAISEKMRRMIRGLNQGTENAQDGASWVQIGDGSLEEVHSMLHRMTQLSVQSLNGTWTDSDRAAMQAEFEQLQKEIDRLTDATTFNEKHIFAEHEIPYYQFEGNIQWRPEQKHAIGGDNNVLNITYRMAEGDSPQTASIQVPMGLYTTKELIDEIDTALEKAGLLDIGMQFEYTTQGTCNLNLEGGVSIDEVTGGLAYLLYDVYGGGSTGALIGTTGFLSDDKPLYITTGENDELSFDIVGLDGNKTHMDLKVPTDIGGTKGYTRPQLIDWLNESLKDTSVVAVKYGLGIKLTSDDSIITGLKGNMFRVDENGYTGVFYDNIGYGPVTMLPGVLTGGGVLSTKRDDLEHGHYYINSSNNELLVSPNGSDTVTTLKILPDGNSEGYFTMEGMMNRLNELFRDNNLDLTASIHGDPVKDDYQGLVITSTVKGLDSDVGIDPASSAYNTLFVTRAYNRVELPESYVRDKDSDKDAYYNAGKTFSQNSWPLIITADGADQNNKFMLTVNQKQYEITLDTGRDGIAAYNNAGELVQAVQNAITALKDTLTDAQEKEYLGSIKVSNLSSSASNATSARLALTSTNRGVDRINVSAASDAAGKVNKGYKDIFTTSVSYTSQTKSGLGSVILNEVISVPVTIYESKQLFRVTVAGEGGGTYDLKLNKGPYNTLDEILAEINSKLPKASDRKDPIAFSPNPATGKGETRVYTSSGKDGSITQATIPKLEAQGTGSQQGVVGGDDSATAASVTMTMRCFNNVGKMDITSQNNTFVIDVNGKQEKIELDIGASYSSVKDLADALQQKLNKKYGSGDSGIKVTASGSNITLTTNLKGQNAKIACDKTSSFVKAAYTDISYSSAQILDGMREAISVNAGDTFIFTYQGKEQTLRFDKTENYDRAGIKKKINELLEAKGLDVRVDENTGSTLTLRSTTPGSGHALSYTSANGGTITTKLFQNANTTNAAATAVIKTAIQDNIQLETGKSSFKIRVGSTDKTVQLPDGKSYTNRSDFLKDLQDALKDQNIGVTATLNKDNQLEFTTIATGSTASISISYDAGSALKAMYGTKSVKQIGLKADFNGGKLQLTAVDEDGKQVNAQVSVSSSTGSIFQTAVQNGTTTAAGTSSAGYHSKIYSAVEGASLRDPAVKINQWNRDLKFTYNYLVTRSDGTTYSSSRNIDIRLDEKIYTYDELKKALEEKLNPPSLSKDARLQVEVSADGVKIKAGNPGRGYYMTESTFSGGFYYNVLRRTAEQAVKTKCKVEKGKNSSGTYAVGRKDIRHNTTEITKGVNDTLTLDFTYGGNPTMTFSMTLDPGKYSGSNLVSHIQKKLNEQLVAAGLEPGLIKAQIGGRTTNVYGNNDQDALIFVLADDIELPSNDKDAEYIIDGIGGNAAFSVFYQTDGDIRIAYVTGTKDVSNGVTIPKDSNFSFDTDGKSYQITMPAGRYSQKKMLEELNAQLKAANAPVIAKVTNGRLTLSHTKYGKHQITNISGDAKKWLFFQEEGAKEGEKDIWIRVGSESGDGVVIERPTMNTSFLGINSVTISKPKYAEKALTRVKKAVTTVSSVRSYFGSMQNRLEHTINQNNNTAENLQAAESAIRDADMAKEVLEMSKASILENVGSSLLSQANRARQDVLSLLQ